MIQNEQGVNRTRPARIHNHQSARQFWRARLPLARPTSARRTAPPLRAHRVGLVASAKVDKRAVAVKNDIDTVAPPGAVPPEAV